MGIQHLDSGLRSIIKIGVNYYNKASYCDHSEASPSSFHKFEYTHIPEETLRPSHIVFLALPLGTKLLFCTARFMLLHEDDGEKGSIGLQNIDIGTRARHRVIVRYIVFDYDPTSQGGKRKERISV